MRSRKEQARDAKERVRRDQIEEWENEVASVSAYLGAIESLHKKPFDLPTCLQRFKSRLDPWTYEPRAFLPVTFNEKLQPKEFEPKQRHAPDYKSSTYAAASLRLFTALGVLALLVGGAGAVWLGAFGGLGAAGVLAVSVVPYLSFSRKQRAYFLDGQSALDSAHAAAEGERRSRHEAEEARLRAEREGRRARFETREATRRRLFEAAETWTIHSLRALDDDRTHVLARALEGDEQSVAKIVEGALPLAFEISAPDDLDGADVTDYEVAYSVDSAKSVTLLVIAPGHDVIPDRIPEMSAARDKVKYKSIPTKQRQEIHTRMVASYALEHARRLFEALPSLEQIDVDTCIMQIDPTSGKEGPRLVVRASYRREKLAQLNLAGVDPIEVLEHFKHQLFPIGTKVKKLPALALDPDEATWASREDNIEEIPYGLLPEHKRAPLWPNAYADSEVKLAEDGTPDADLHPGATKEDVQAALDAALPGARVHVRAGRYQGPVTIRTPLQLLGEAGAVFESNGQTAIRIESPSCTIDRIVVECPDPGLGLQPLVSVSSGHAALRRCELTSTKATVIPLLTIRHGGTVEADGCSLRGGVAGFWVSNGKLDATNCTIEDFTFAVIGSPGSVARLRAGHIRGCEHVGYLASGAALYLEGCELTETGKPTVEDGGHFEVT